MKTYEELANSVIYKIYGSTVRLLDKANELELVGKGRSAYAFKIKSTNLVIKVYFPTHREIGKEETTVYTMLKENPFFPTLHAYGENYIVIDYISGQTFFNCLIKGIPIKYKHILEVDMALKLVRGVGLNPSDVHLRNIILTKDGHVKLIDVARFRQRGECSQWEDLKKAYKLYRRRFIPKQIPTFLLNSVAFIYKKRWFKAWIKYI
ncbi:MULTISPECIES: protein kinase family protein [Bacillus]|uniref:serine/threonine protein kinase n=1 Tax=Bacillus TaxID=1386 RepID=UPI000BB78A80|nr:MULTISPECIES: serine/threonine protein kinase [Bacillus]